MDLGLQGRHALITGGSMGIGKAIAQSFAAEGVNVSLLARGQQALDQAVAEITAKQDVMVAAVMADLTAPDQVDAAVQQAVAALGPVNILVHNAGHRMTRPDRQLGWDDQDWLSDINIKTVGMLRVLRALDAHWATDGSGAVISVTGIAGQQVLGQAMTHGINNAAINHITGYLARDLASKNVRVNAVSPGLVATEWRQGWAKTMGEKNNQTPEEFVAGFMHKLGGMTDRWASMEEIADVVVFLASDRARYINGTVITVDGGVIANPR